LPSSGQVAISDLLRALLTTTEGNVQALTELWTFATAWYNLPFTLALLAFLGLSAVQFIGLEQDHDADVDAHVDLDHDVSLDHDLDVDHDLDLEHGLDVDHDVSVDHDADLGHDLDHDLDHDVGHDAGGAPAWTGALRFLGVGQAPLTMVLLVLLGGFGMLGWIANASVLGIMPQYPAWVLAIVLLFDLFIAAWFTSRVAGFIGRAVPAFASTATSVKRLVSRRGHVVSPQVDEKYGQVKVRDPGGTLITVFAVVDPGKPPIPRDAEVVLVEYDEAKKVFVVVPSDL
jgi:membrane protein implicated in regulation of membrane protease activity